MAVRTLLLVRHAKAGYPDDVSDHDRPLTTRGERDATALGERWRGEETPDLVLCSSAVRARQTWDCIERAIGRPTTVRYEPSLYLAPPREILGLVRGVQDEVTRLVVVGHNPGMHELAGSLSGGGDKALRRELALRMPTCGVAALSVPSRWDELAPGSADLVGLLAPS